MNEQNKEWEKIKERLYEMDEFEFAKSRDTLFKDIDRLFLAQKERMISDVKQEISQYSGINDIQTKKLLDLIDRNL